MGRRTEIDAALGRLAPKVPAFERGVIVDHAMDSRGLKPASAETAAWLSLVAYVRHTFTDYDDLLDEGFDRESARHFVADAMDAVLSDWGVRRSVADGVDADPDDDEEDAEDEDRA
ncbi:DUF2293 domain-containing protein [Mongoliimonas terrestris]|uniref:DUF2293 domain-containing protein n=1 Tax=Mongoliimonas terrestris TaxID=1709001 RepID=UPI0009496A75|nr:DUF2293 domain-containing protein [Mongoliimonas terrestris]